MAIQDAIPRSRITLTYRTTISGQPEEVELPFRMLVLGDLTCGTATEEDRGELEERPLHTLNGSNLNEVMASMNMNLKMTVGNYFTGGADEVAIPIDSMDALHPDAVAQHIPDVQVLILMKKLLEEMNSYVSNRKALRGHIKALFKDRKVGEARDQLAQTGLDKLKLPEDLRNRMRQLVEGGGIPDGE